jgi:high affinity sulfate transporter 1
MAKTAPDRRRFPLPLLEGVLPLDRARLPAELVAGVTLAALAIPEVMGYTKIAGMPVITGLYTILVPLLLYALLGSSRHLVVGADSASAAILAAGLAGMAATASEQYVALAGLVALLTAAFLIVARLVGLGFLADFLSRTVLVGVLTGVGIQVAAGQVGGMLGVPSGTGGTLEKLWGTLQNVGETDGATLAVSLAVLAVILFGKRVTTVIPGALVAVIGAIVVSWALDLEADGVAVLGPVPGGLPSIALPDVAASDIKPLLTTAFSIFVVILAQSAATSRAYAAKYGDRFDENTDLVGLGFANVGAGLTGTFVVNGSPTKTQMVDSAGGRSQVAALATVGLVALVLLFLTKPLQYMPEAVLASVVFLIGVELVDWKGMRHILAVRRDEFVVAAIVAAIVVVVGVEQGVLLAIVLSLLDHVRRGYRPNNSLVVQQADGTRRVVPASEGGEAEPGLVVYRFAASLYYANANHLEEEVRALAAAEPPPAWIAIDASAIADVDYTGGETLKELHAELAAAGQRLLLTRVSDDVRRELDRYGVSALVGQDAIIGGSSDELLDLYRRAAPERPATKG